MVPSDHVGDRSYLERALRLAAALQEAVEDPTDLSAVPALMAEATGVREVTITFMAQTQGDEARVLATATTADARRASDATLSSTTLQQVLVTRELDETHRFVLAARMTTDDGRADAATVEMLERLCDHLARGLRVAMTSLAFPTRLGGPYETLTEREWAVLCGLNSDDGEKQLAARLALSPHTLHSHIKTVYRKIGVQGRIPLIRKFQRTMRDFRSHALIEDFVADASSLTAAS